MTIDEIQMGMNRGFLVNDQQESGPYRIEKLLLPDKVELTDLAANHSMVTVPNDLYFCDARGKAMSDPLMV